MNNQPTETQQNPSLETRIAEMRAEMRAKYAARRTSPQSTISSAQGETAVEDWVLRMAEQARKDLAMVDSHRANRR